MITSTIMPEFGVDSEPIYVFEIDETLLFIQYFEHDDLFDELSDYYDHDRYRFEVPKSEFDTVRERLGDYFYEPVIVEDFKELCVVKEEYTEHADILRNSVEKWSREGYNLFLLKDPLSVDEAVEQGPNESRRPILSLEFDF